MGLRADEQQLVSGSADGVICLWCVLWHCSVVFRMLWLCVWLGGVTKNNFMLTYTENT